MRAVVQRVSRASVRVDGAVVASIDHGLLVLVAVAPADDTDAATTLAEKVAHLRVFPDDEDKMNRSLLDVAGGALVVSQFTLYGDTRKGRRPSFGGAASPDRAEPLVEVVVDRMQALGLPVSSGVFGASMDVELVNRGPVTLIVESG